jgi:predicted nucleic acid-binding protein
MGDHSLFHGGEFVSFGSSYLLDTTVLIDISRGREPAASWLRGALRSRARISISAMTVTEHFAGLRPDKRSEWQRFVDQLTLYDVTKEISVQAGIFRYDFARRGRTIQTPDAVIAATAMFYQATLVTCNIKDFPMPEIKTIRLRP